MLFDSRYPPGMDTGLKMVYLRQVTHPLRVRLCKVVGWVREMKGFRGHVKGAIS